MWFELDALLSEHEHRRDDVSRAIGGCAVRDVVILPAGL